MRDALLQGHTLYISVATVAEIMAGIRSGEEDATEALFSLFTIYGADEPLAVLPGIICGNMPGSIA